MDSHVTNGLKSLLYSLTKNELEVRLILVVWWTLVSNLLRFQVPEDFICPITYEIMSDPVMCEDGFSYERSAILEWFAKDKTTSPMTNCLLTSTTVFENNKLKREIENYLKKLDFDPFE